MLRLFLIAVTASACATSAVVRAGDWPQILGPERNGVAGDESPLGEWPKSGPPEVWKAPVGQGFAGVAVSEGTVFLFHRRGSAEIVTALQASDGSKIWSQSFSTDYRSGISSDSGPRCVPLAADGRVYVFGAAGGLRCLNAETGEIIWVRDTWKDFSAPEGYFGAGSSPVLWNEHLIVNVGGRNDSSVVAFSAKTGETQWQSFDDGASYSSPVIHEADGVSQAIVVTRLHTVSLDPQNGEVRWQFPFGARGPTVNAACPIVTNDQLFVTASYRVGSATAVLGNDSVRPEMTGEEFLASQYATPIPYEDVLFAVDGRQDVGTAALKCIDPVGRRVLWSETGFDYGTLVRVSRELLFLTCGGDLIRFDADREQFRMTQKCRVLSPTPDGYRLPAISGGRLFIRDNAELRCLQISP